MNGLRALLFRAGKLGVVFEDAGGSFLRTPPRNVGMRDDFLRWCVRVIQIIDASVQRHVIQRVRFQHFADRLLVIGGNLSRTTAGSCPVISIMPTKISE